MTQHDATLSRIFQALSDPTRRAILTRLMKGQAPVTELAQPTGMALPTVLRHLTVLEDAGLIETEKTGRTRVCRACPATLDDAETWLQGQRRMWEAQTDRLEAFLATMETDDDRPLQP
jgi:DNA-binding transcriptional ArsR family regulator